MKLFLNLFSHILMGMGIYLYKMTLIQKKWSHLTHDGQLPKSRENHTYSNSSYL